MIGFWVLKQRNIDAVGKLAAINAMLAFQDRPPAPSPAPVPTDSHQPITVVSGIPDWLTAVISRHAPDDLSGNADFYRVVAAGAKAESGWDPNRVQPNGGGRGLFQFDINGGMGTGIPVSQLFDPDFQAARIVPIYAQFYRQRPANGDAEVASWIAAMAERPYDYQNPSSLARRNYAVAYRGIV